jgi:amino acid adenylation domain-containing protein
MRHLASDLEASARRYPDRVAVVDPDGRELTYRELDDRASRIAGFLQAAGVAPGDRVALAMPKGGTAVTLIFGILKARAAYVPIDWSGPVERTAAILRQSGAVAACLHSMPHGKLLAAAPEVLPATVIVAGDGDGKSTIAYEAVMSHAPSSESLADRRGDEVAYILFTSGSTGVPKGVTLTHENATSFVDWCSHTFKPTEEDRFGSHAPFHFDLSVFDIYVAIKHGAAIHIVSEALGQSPKLLARWILDRGLTVWYSTPSILTLLTQFGDLDALSRNQLRLVLFAGEVFPVKHLRQITAHWPHPTYYNLYGPTETNVCTFARIPLPIPGTRTEPFSIGHPCAHCEALVLDSEDGREVTSGEEGLLYITGSSVFRDYWNRADLTESAFITRRGARWYNTGDVVRSTDDGYIYLGRRDRMIKRRGYRIELGEVEQGLYKSARVREAAAVAISDGDGVKIVAFLTLHADAVRSIIEMKQHCAAVLPTSMSPDVFVFVEELPRTSTQKVDYQRLIRDYVPV